MRGLARMLSVVVVLVLPASASAARSWQAPQPLASDLQVSAEASNYGSRERSIYLDNAGNALVEVGNNSGMAPYYRYLVRPHAGALGGTLTYPSGIGSYLGARPLVNVSAAGEVLVDDTGYNGNAFGPLGGTLTTGTATPVGNPSAVAEVPSGAAAGVFATGAAPYVAFRAPGQSFDFAHELTLPLPAGYDYGQPAGIALDPDGGTVVVYGVVSTTSPFPHALLQTFAPAGGSFGTPTQLDAAGTGSGGGGSMAWGRDGHAVVAWFDYATNKVLYAATRAPGGPFGPATVIADDSAGNGFIGAPYVAVSDTGTALVGYSHIGPLGVFSCSNDNSSAVASVAISTGSGFTPTTPAGGDSYLVGLGAGGDRLAAVISGKQGCPGASLNLYSGTGTSISGDGNLALGTAGFAAMAVGPSGDMLVGYRLGEGQQLRAFEDPTGSPAGTPGGGGTPGLTPGTPGASGTPAAGTGTGTNPPVFMPPVSIKLSGPILVVGHNPPSIGYTCLVEGKYRLTVCKINIQATVPSSASASAKHKAHKPIVFATGSGTIRAGKTGKIKLKLTKAGLASLIKTGKLTVVVVATVTRGPTVTKVTNRVVFKAAKHHH